MGRGHTDTPTDTHAHGHRDSMIESAQWADSMKITQTLFMSSYVFASLAVPEVHGLEGEVHLDRVVVDVAEGGAEHGEAVEGDDAAAKAGKNLDDYL